MSKKFFVIVVAIVLVCAITGVCFALYYKSATATVTLTTGDAITLTLASDPVSLDVADYDPDEGAKVFKITLHINNAGDLATNGQVGSFKLAATGDLAAALDFTAVACTDNNFLDEGATAVDAAFASTGINYLLSDTPIYIKVTMNFKSSVTKDVFVSTYAETTGSIAFSWTIPDWVQQYTTPYLLGEYGGLTMWAPDRVAKVFSTVTDPESNNGFELINVALQAGEKVKPMKKGEGEGTDTWYAFDRTDVNGATNNSLATFDTDGNAVINATGNYSFFINKNTNLVYMATYVTPVEP